MGKNVVAPTDERRGVGLVAVRIWKVSNTFVLGSWDTLLAADSSVPLPRLLRVLTSRGLRSPNSRLAPTKLSICCGIGFFPPPIPLARKYIRCCFSPASWGPLRSVRPTLGQVGIVVHPETWSRWSGAQPLQHRRRGRRQRARDQPPAFDVSSKRL